jgi:osmotically-inducible protein OsmY
VAALHGRDWLIARRLAPVLMLLLSACAADKAPAGSHAANGDASGDAKACRSIRSALRARAPGSLSVLSVLCRHRLVVIAGALPPDYKPAVEAVHIATKTPGVGRVETFFVPRPAQDTGDSAIASRIRLALAANAGATRAGTDLAVVAGTVVLVGAVDDQAQADRIIASAGSVAGVKSVKSFLELKQ